MLARRGAKTPGAPRPGPRHVTVGQGRCCPGVRAGEGEGCGGGTQGEPGLQGAEEGELVLPPDGGGRRGWGG